MAILATLGLILVTYHARIAWYHNGFVDSVWSAGVGKFGFLANILRYVDWLGKLANLSGLQEAKE